MTDSELYSLMEESPPKGRKALFDEYCNYVYAIVASKLRTCGTREDMEECISDIFAEIFRKCGNKSEYDGNLKALICTVAKCRAVDTYRRLSRHGNTISIEEKSVNELRDENNIEESAERSEIRSIILKKIHELGKPDSEIIIQQYFYNRTLKDIAKSMSMTEAAVQKRSIRARKKLKKLLTDSGIGGIT